MIKFFFQKTPYDASLNKIFSESDTQKTPYDASLNKIFSESDTLWSHVYAI